MYQFNRESVYKDIILILWLVKTITYILKIVRRFCEITVALDFIFRLVLCSREDVSFNSICPNVLEGIKQFTCSNRQETPFKGDNVKALITSSPMGNDHSPESQHNVWRPHNLRCSKADNSELETVTRN